MTAAGRRLLEVMRRPVEAERLPPPDWTPLLSVARSANMLGALGERVQRSGVSIPREVSRHLDGMAQLSRRQRESVRWETHLLADALNDLGIPVLLLKGAAYVMGGLPTRIGRIFGDIDILVPRSNLGDVELALMTRGWTSAKRSEYDQRYYREWMHELPPMVNVRRGTVLDIHHTILPLTSRHHPDPQKLIAASSALPGLSPLRIPSPHDLLIHSITHLFHEGELHNGLRDLFDIDGLIAHFSQTEENFWPTLLERAEELELLSPLFLGLHFATRILDTPVPPSVLDDCRERSAPSPFAVRMLEMLYDRGLQPMHPDCDTSLTGIARWLLYVRAHWLRMPPHLLSMHLSRKAWKSLFPEQRLSPHEANEGLPP